MHQLIELIWHPSSDEAEQQVPEGDIEATADELPLSQEDVVVIETIGALPSVTESSLTTEPQNQDEVLPAASSTCHQEVDALSSDMAASSQHVNSNLQTKSQNLLAELSSQNRTSRPFLSREMAVSREALECFLNMGGKVIQRADAFGNIEQIMHAIILHTDNLLEKIVLEHFVSWLAESRESTPISTTIAEAAQARKTSLSEKATDLDARLSHKKNVVQCPLKLLDEEEKLEAEIRRLITQKEELLAHKKSFARQLEKVNQETAEDLEELQSLKEEMKQANTEWLGAKEKLELVNVHWKPLKENLKKKV
ncbi:hypothetical protein JCGZ_23889 [Jatropha curcas]|uniref:Uncharacterized protein n=1 Tax=Jatropha curcas TaxID=180498 RepID=A0A067L3E1_JATCU|nr:hypothetical protein JCGZ_23889 [Jatropha curcas]